MRLGTCRVGARPLPSCFIAVQSRGNAICLDWVRIVYHTDQDDTALALVAAGIGLAFVPAHFGGSAVKQIPVLDLRISRAIGLLWSRGRAHAGLKDFIEFAGGHCWAV